MSLSGFSQASWYALRVQLAMGFSVIAIERLVWWKPVLDQLPRVHDLDDYLTSVALLICVMIYSLYVIFAAIWGVFGETFNINGDTVAGAIAGALSADRLLLLTDVSGVKNADGDVLTEMNSDQIREMTASGVIAGGMIPKTETALAALEEGVKAVVILDGRAPNACLLELFTEHGAGSIIRLA